MSRRSHHAGAKDPAVDGQLAEAVEQLVNEFKPESIYLFGSVLEGHNRPESSVDVLVIAKGISSMRFLDRIKRAMKVTEESLPTITPLLYTPAEVQLLQKQGDGFMQEVLDDGRLLYKKK